MLNPFYLVAGRALLILEQNVVVALHAIALSRHINLVATLGRTNEIMAARHLPGVVMHLLLSASLAPAEVQETGSESESSSTNVHRTLRSFNIHLFELLHKFMKLLRISS
jgi:hypothetical protein